MPLIKLLILVVSITTLTDDILNSVIHSNVSRIWITTFIIDELSSPTGNGILN